MALGDINDNAKSNTFLKAIQDGEGQLDVEQKVDALFDDLEEAIEECQNKGDIRRICRVAKNKILIYQAQAEIKGDFVSRSVWRMAARTLNQMQFNR